MKLVKIAGLAGTTLLLAGMIAAFAGCAPETKGGESSTTGSTAQTGGQSKADYSGQELSIDGSGTVFPIAAAATELFNSTMGQAKITVGKSGTGSGMKMFVKGEIGIADASRPIKADEIAELEKAKIEFIEMPVALDGLCIIVNKENTWLKSITIEQLHKIWDKDSKVKMWSEVDPSWPKEEIKLYGPTDAHGTYEYFNEVVNGKKDNVRPDYSQQSEYDPLIAGVAGEKNSLGYVGFAYFDGNKDKVRAVPVDGGKGPVEPSEASITDGTYSPFGRPLFMYVNKAKMGESKLLADFVAFMLGEHGSEAVKAGDYLPLPADIAAMVKARVDAGTTGSIFSSAAPGASVADILKNAK